MLLQVNKSLFLLILLAAAVVANASPTVTTDNSIVPTVRMASDTPGMIVPNNEVIQPIDSKLANLGRKLLAPPASSAVLGNAPGNHVKALPAVPAAFFMALIGFLCVSLVKDRRVWLTALAGLLWASQAGIQALPQLALRLCHRNHIEQLLYAELTYPYYLNNSSRLRSDIEGTQYIGLLHHLAGIPDAKSASANPRLAELIAFSRHNRRLYGKVFNSPHRKTHTFHSAVILEQYCLNSLFKCLASKAKQFICFSPAFIFDNLARGPPLLA